MQKIYIKAFKSSDNLVFASPRKACEREHHVTYTNKIKMCCIQQCMNSVACGNTPCFFSRGLRVEYMLLIVFCRVMLKVLSFSSTLFYFHI
jgi:hypothetical protein